MIILFDGELNEVLGNVVIEQLLDVYTKNQAIMEANDRLKYKSDYLPLYCDEIEFRINSEGGDLFKFLEIWDIIERMKEEQGVIFKGRVSSHAYSAGFYLLCACDYRTVSRFASVMCHEMSLGNMMKLSDWSLEADRKAKTQQYLDDLVVKNTKITQEMLDSYKGRDFWMDYGDCVKYGIIKEESTEEERLAKELEDFKEDMTESEWNAFIEEMKSYVNIIPDEPKPTEEEIQDKIKEIEGNTEPDMTLGEAVKEVLGEDFKCNGETKCNEFGDRCCYMCENFGKCDLLCECAERAETCEHIENKLDELDSECECKVPCEDCICKENKQEDIKECEESTQCELHRGTNTCCYFCDDVDKCVQADRCGAIEVFMNSDNKEEFNCDYFRTPLDEQE
jgi:ATP-dependent protease ClpP protease subunit